MQFCIERDACIIDDNLFKEMVGTAGRVYHIVVMIITHSITDPSEGNEIFIKSKEMPHVETRGRGDGDHRWR